MLFSLSPRCTRFLLATLLFAGVFHHVSAYDGYNYEEDQTVFASFLEKIFGKRNLDFGLYEELYKHVRVFKAMASNPRDTVQQIWRNLRNTDLQARRFKQGFTDLKGFSLVVFYKWLWLPLAESLVFKGDVGQRLRKDIEEGAQWWAREVESLFEAAAAGNGGVLEEKVTRMFQAGQRLIATNGLAQVASVFLLVLVGSVLINVTGAMFSRGGNGAEENQEEEEEEEVSRSPLFKMLASLSWYVVCIEFA